MVSFRDAQRGSHRETEEAGDDGGADVTRRDDDDDEDEDFKGGRANFPRASLEKPATISFIGS